MERLELVLFLLLGFAVLENASSAKKVSTKKLKARSTSWTNCGFDSDPIQIISLDIGPDSIHIPGEVTISAQVTINSDIQAPVKVDVVAKKKMAFAWIEIPCWQQQFGSCKFDDGCALSPYQALCPAFFDDHQIPCHCPVSKGSYQVSNVTTQVDLQVPDWLEKGFYKAQVKLSQDDQQLACYEFVSHFA